MMFDAYIAPIFRPDFAYFIVLRMHTRDTCSYKVRYPPYEAKKGEMPITLLTEEMKLSAFDKIKQNLGFGGGSKKKGASDDKKW